MVHAHSRHVDGLKDAPLEASIDRCVRADTRPLIAPGGLVTILAREHYGTGYLVYFMTHESRRPRLEVLYRLAFIQPIQGGLRAVWNMIC